MHRKGSPGYGGVDVNWGHPFFKGASFIFVQHGKQVWVNGRIISDAKIDYSGLILRGPNGKPIRLCGSSSFASLYPVPSNYTLDSTLIMQGILSRSVNNIVSGSTAYYGIWYNTAGAGRTDVNYGNGGTNFSASRKTCNFACNRYDTVATATYGSLDPSTWGIYVEGLPASNRTYSGSASSFLNGSGTNAQMGQGWDPSVTASSDTRTGIFIYMNKSLTAEELASVSADIYQLFRPATFQTFFDIPKESLKLPATVPYKRKQTNQPPGLLKVSNRYKTKFAISAGSGFVDIVSGTGLTQEFSGASSQIVRLGGKYRGFGALPPTGAGGLVSQVKKPLRKSMTIAFCMTVKPQQQATFLASSLGPFIDDIAYASGFGIQIDPFNEIAILAIGLDDNSLNGSYVITANQTWIPPYSDKVTLAFEVDLDGTIRTYRDGVERGSPLENGVDFLFPNTVGASVTDLSLLSSSILDQGWDNGVLHAFVITDGIDGVALSSNIWSAFEGPVGLPDISPHDHIVAMQALSPSSDVSPGGWTPSSGTTLYEVLDEVSADDSDYITASVATTCEVKLAPAVDPLTSGNHSITYRVLPGIGNITATLKCGTVTIATWGPHILTGATQEFTQVLSSGQADSITDYADIRVVFTSS